MQWLAERRAHIGAVVDDVRIHDLDLLARLSRGQLTAQFHARWLLYQHLHSVWETAKADGLNPAMDPVWSSVALLCDVTSALVHSAFNVRPDMPALPAPGRP